MPYQIISRKVITLLFLAGLLFSACQATSKATPMPDETSAPFGTPTPFPGLSGTLVVCLGEEPNTLYPFGSPNAAARSVLAAIYDGPIDIVSYKYQPVILEKLPNIKDGDALIDSVEISVGDEIVDASGNLATLDVGVRVRPSGCRNDDCAITYDGTSKLEMDQMVVNFSLLPDLIWSDVTPLTAADSVYAYSLAADLNTPGTKFLIEHTQAYEAIDDLTVQWWGKPGYIDPTYFTNFWSPAPQHVWGEFQVDELPQTEAVSRAPLGWGAYVLDEWVPGERITLTRNPHYFRAEENLPKFETLIFNFFQDPDSALSALLAGDCDLLDPTVRLDGQVGLLLQLREAKQIRAEFRTTMTMERLDFGIRPASYDDGYKPGSDRPDILADKRTRQAVAMCLDRQKVVDTVLYGLSVVPNVYIPPDNPLYDADVTAYSFNVATAKQLLDQVGWIDHDNDPATPRRAVSVAGVPSGFSMTLNYFTTSAVQRRQVSEILSGSLAQCGIGVNIQYYSPNDFYAEGPTGPLFGRKFDLAQYAMGTTGIEPPCSWYMSSDIPEDGNHWVGTNVSGYSNDVYDLACQTAMQSLPDEAGYVENFNSTQAIFVGDLPSIPLYPRLKVAASRPDLCNFTLEPATYSDLWAVETFDINKQCKP